MARGRFVVMVDERPHAHPDPLGLLRDVDRALTKIIDEAKRRGDTIADSTYAEAADARAQLRDAIYALGGTYDN